MAHENADIVDLRSDTVTKPTGAMREAMAAGPVGDDVLGEDPTINDLEKHAAKLFGKEAALFVPSGTMANLTAILATTEPGDAIILSEDAHPFRFESANIARVGGLLTKTIPAADGILTAEKVAAKITRSRDPHLAETSLVTIENTTNMGGGQIYPLETIAEVAALAREHGMKVHCDGARIFNAVAATGISPSEYAKEVDTLSFCFSKGLGAPVGSMIVCDRETYARAHRFRKMLGGGMRQAGIIAAAARYALDHHVERLKDDHARATAFRAALEGVDGITFPMPSPTNIVMLDVPDATRFVADLADRDVLCFNLGPKRIRAVFHLDVTDDHLERAIDAFHEVAESLAKTA